MNRDCFGDFYSLNGHRYYRCFLDSTVVHGAEGLRDDSECPHCHRPICGTDHGEVEMRQRLVVEVLTEGKWRTHSEKKGETANG